MIYKVSGEFTNENLTNFINKLKERFKVLYQNENIYLAIKDYNQEIKLYKTLEEVNRNIKDYLKTKIFIPMGDFFVKDLSNSQIGSLGENDFVKTWIQENLIRIEKQRLENEKQKELINVWNGLDTLEKIIEDELRKVWEEKDNK